MSPETLLPYLQPVIAIALPAHLHLGGKHREATLKGPLRLVRHAHLHSQERRDSRHKVLAFANTATAHVCTNKICLCVQRARAKCSMNTLLPVSHCPPCPSPAPASRSS